MKISPINNAVVSLRTNKIPNKRQLNTTCFDTFEKSNHHTSEISFKSASNQTDISMPKEAGAYKKTLSEGIKHHYGDIIPPQNFKNVISPAEFRLILPTLKQENFEYSPENFDKGIYFADLDNQSTFSSGINSPLYMLDRLSGIANILNKNTGKKFIFSIADRDSLDGVKAVVQAIGKNPSRYRNILFVPGIKMSFAHEAPHSSEIGYENSELLVYGINPYSDNVNALLDTIIKHREIMTRDFIIEADELYPDFDYDINEFIDQNGLFYRRDYTVSNLYWRLREYAEKKGGSSIAGPTNPPDKILYEADDIVNELPKVYIGSDLSGSVSPISGIVTDDKVNKTIKEIFNEYSTRYDPKKKREVSYAENLYFDIINCLSDEQQKPVITVASPYYFAHFFDEKTDSNHFPHSIEFFKLLQNTSNGMFAGFETVAPAYGLDKILGQDSIDNFNNCIRQTQGLNNAEVGGSLHKYPDF